VVLEGLPVRALKHGEDALELAHGGARDLPVYPFPAWIAKESLASCARIASASVICIDELGVETRMKFSGERNCDSPGVYHVEEAGQRQDHRHGPFALLTTHRNYPGFWEEPSRQGFLQTGGASPLPHYHRDLHPFREPSAGPKRGWIEDRRLLSEELPDLGESLSLDRGYLDQCRAALRAS